LLMLNLALLFVVTLECISLSLTNKSYVLVMKVSFYYECRCVVASVRCVDLKVSFVCISQLIGGH
jgi:hypothetical protein